MLALHLQHSYFIDYLYRSCWKDSYL